MTVNAGEVEEVEVGVENGEWRMVNGRSGRGEDGCLAAKLHNTRPQITLATVC